jgi:LPS export ABC transporter permease LptG/LPS export ABC transporter permease LptF
MLRIVNRSIIAETVPYLLISTVLLTVIIFAGQVSEFSELFVKKNVPPSLVRTLLYSIIPRILILTVPVSVLIATMMAFGRMSSDVETVALFASGITRRQLLTPTLGLALVASAAVFYLAAVEMPQGARRFKDIRAQLILQGIRTQIKPRVFDDRFANKVLYVDEITRRTDTWDRILLASMEDGPEPIIVTARRGSLDLGDTLGQSQLNLTDGVIHKRTTTKNEDRYDVEVFSQSQVRFDATGKEAQRLAAETSAPPSLRARVLEMTLTELVSAVGGSDLGRRSAIELHRRLAISVSPIVFALLGALLVIARAGVGRGAGLSLAILSAAFYYLLFLGGENLARSGNVPAIVGLWAANGLFLGLALALLRTRHFTFERQPFIAPIQSLFRWLAPHFHQLGPIIIRLWRRRVGRVGRYGRNRSSNWPLLVDRYLGRRFLGLFFLILLGFWVLFLVFTTFELSSDIASNRTPLFYVASYLFYLTPFVVGSIAPPSALIAALVSVSLVGRTSELIALRAAGRSVYRTVLPLLIVCLLVSLAALGWQQAVVPASNAKQEELRFYIKKGRFPTPAEVTTEDFNSNWRSAIEPTVVSGLSRGGRVFHFRSFDPRSNRLDHPLVLELRPSDFTVSRRIEAAQARWDVTESAWVFRQAMVWEFDGEKIISQERHERFQIPLREGPDYFKQPQKKPEAMSFKELDQTIRRLEQSGLDAAEMKVVLERKKASATACLVLGLFGIPFGLRFGRKGALHAVSVGILSGLVFWLAVELFAQMGKHGYFSPTVAAWAPNALLTSAGAYLLFRTRT